MIVHLVRDLGAHINSQNEQKAKAKYLKMKIKLSS